MATWKVLCDIVLPKPGDSELFPEIEILGKEIIFVEDFVINIFKTATETARKELGHNWGFVFNAIDRTDKRTGKNYYEYLLDRNSGVAPSLRVNLNKHQIQYLNTAISQIYEHCYSKSPAWEAEERLLYYPDGFLRRLKPNVSILIHNFNGNIMNHDEFKSLSNFYSNVNPDELSILNMEHPITVDEYDTLRNYYILQSKG